MNSWLRAKRDFEAVLTRAATCNFTEYPRLRKKLLDLRAMGEDNKALGYLRCLAFYVAGIHRSVPRILRKDLDSYSSRSSNSEDPQPIEVIDMVADSDSDEDGIHNAVDLETAVLEAGAWVVAGMPGAVGQPAPERIKEESAADPSPAATSDTDDASSVSNRPLRTDTVATRQRPLSTSSMHSPSTAQTETDPEWIQRQEVEQLQRRYKQVVGRSARGGNSRGRVCH